MKKPVNHDQKYELDILKIPSWHEGNLKFVEGTIRTSIIIDHMVAKLERYRQSTGEMREVLKTHMDQHHFPHMHMFVDLFSKWVDYDKVNSLD